MALKCGLLNAWALKAYKEGEISLGKLAEIWQKETLEMMDIVSSMGIDPLAYDLVEDIETIEKMAR